MVTGMKKSGLAEGFWRTWHHSGAAGFISVLCIVTGLGLGVRA